MENKFNGAFGAFLQSFEGLLGEFVNCAKPSSLIQRDGKEMMGESSRGTQVGPKSPPKRLIEGGLVGSKVDWRHHRLFNKLSFQLEGDFNLNYILFLSSTLAE